MNIYIKGCGGICPADKELLHKKKEFIKGSLMQKSMRP